MKLQRIFLLFTWLIFNLFVQAMEERPSVKPMPALVPDIEDETGQPEQTRVLLELTDNEKVIYAIQIPMSFAQESSVISNNLAFQEEEEGKELSVQFDSSYVTIEQLKALQTYIDKNYSRRNMKQTLSILSDEWYPDNVRMFINLLIIANFIGNEDLYDSCLQKTYELLKRALQERKLNVFFEINSLLETLDIQEELKSIVLKNSMLGKLYQIKFISAIKKFHAIAPLSDNKWLVALYEGRELEHEIPPFSYFSKIITLPDNTIVSEFKVPNFTFSRSHFYFSYSKKILYVIGINEIKLYDIETGRNIKNIRTPGQTFSISFSDDDTLLLAILNDRILIYDMNTLKIKEQFNIEPTIEQAHNAVLSSDGVFMAFVKNKHQLEVWDLTENATIETIELVDKETVFSLGFWNNNRSLLYVNSFGEIKIFDIQSKKTETIQAYQIKENDKIWDAIFNVSSDGIIAVSFITHLSQTYLRNSYPPEISLWDLKTKSKIIKIERKYITLSLSFSLDGKSLAFGDGGQNLYEIDLLPKSLQHLTLPSTLLLWYLFEQVKNSQPLDIPKGYEWDFIQLPMKFRKELRRGVHKEVLSRSSLLLWQLTEQMDNDQPLEIPKGYQELFIQLPKKVREYFHTISIARGQPPTAIPYIYPQYKVRKTEQLLQFLKEKRKKPEEKEGGKQKEKSASKRFKWD